MSKNEIEHSNKNGDVSKPEEKRHQEQDKYNNEIEPHKDTNDTTLYYSSDSECNITEELFDIYNFEIDQKYKSSLAEELEICRLKNFQRFNQNSLI